MSTRRSLPVLSTGGSSLLGSNPTAQSGETPKLPRRRLKISDINVVDKQMLKKALGGTIVGNTME